MVSSSTPHGSDSTYANFNLKVGSLNIHGQGKSQIKLRKVKNSFTRGNFDIFLIQETRTDGTERELKKWQKVFNTKHIFLTTYMVPELWEQVLSYVVMRPLKYFLVFMTH